MDVVALLWLLFQRFGLLVSGCFILMQIGPVRGIFSKRPKRWKLCTFALMFGLLGIIGTHALYLTPLDAYPNLRAMAVITAGILQGPLVGLGAGLIAGTYRLALGGFSVVPCTLATLIEGVAAGIVVKRLNLDRLSWRNGFIICAFGEAFHMLLVLIISKPFPQALALVKVITIPMMLVNSLGTAFVIAIISLVLKSEERVGAVKAQKALNIATQTVGYLRTGLNFDSASRTVEIIYDMMNFSAVAITDRFRTLAYKGIASDHHRIGESRLTLATKEVISKGHYRILLNRSEIGCPFDKCPLRSGLIMPLKQKNKVVGTLKLFQGQTNRISQVDIEMALGLSQLFSIQLELEEIEQQARLVDKAEIRALQAQINPHFLFNALNTIVSFSRTDTERSRELLLHLGNFFRSTLKSGNSDFVSFEREMDNLRSYLIIEEARFGNRIKIIYSVEHRNNEWKIPHFTLQPLVENAIKHGLASKEKNGVITISTRDRRDHLLIAIEDNGVGIAQEGLNNIFSGNGGSNNNCGMGLNIINQRLKYLYGPDYGMVIESAVGTGTKICIKIPRSSLLQKATTKMELAQTKV